MSFNEELVKFTIQGYKKNHSKFITDGIHDFVLKDKKDNFITPPPINFKYHRWAGSLKSSQAFAYNVFSGINNPTLKFEFPMAVFDRDAQIDVMFEDEKSQIIELYEVKAFEIINIGKNKIKFEDKYFTKAQYKRSEIADLFIVFLKTVIKNFEDKRIYGGGIKQLCSHLLGIINTINITDYSKKKFKLYSFCFDNPFIPKFEQDIENYKETLTSFKVFVDEFLKNIEVDSQVEYCGFLSAKEYMNKNEIVLGQENYNYIMNRYFI